jgi:alkyldihydroxyacetonephosphate synthase
VASDTLLSCGATITHHHAVGRLHRPWYERERPALFASALAGAKRAVDPTGIMNPGVLLAAEP